MDIQFGARYWIALAPVFIVAVRSGLKREIPVKSIEILPTSNSWNIKYCLKLKQEMQNVGDPKSPPQ